MSIRRMKCILHSIKDSRELRNSRTYSSNFLRISLTSSLSMSVIVEVLRRIVNGAMCSNTTRAQHKSASPLRRKRRKTFQPNIILKTLYIPIRSDKVSMTAFSLHIKLSVSFLIAMLRGIDPKRGRSIPMAMRCLMKYIRALILIEKSYLTNAPSWSQRKFQIFSKRPTVCKRQSYFAKILTTPNVCGKLLLTKMLTKYMRALAMLFVLPATVRRAKKNSIISLTRKVLIR